MMLEVHAGRRQCNDGCEMPTFTECIGSVLLFDYVTKSLILCMTRHYNPNSYTSDCLIQFLPTSGPEIPSQDGNGYLKPDGILPY